MSDLLLATFWTLVAFVAMHYTLVAFGVRRTAAIVSGIVFAILFLLLVAISYEFPTVAV